MVTLRAVPARTLPSPSSLKLAQSELTTICTPEPRPSLNRPFYAIIMCRMSSPGADHDIMRAHVQKFAPMVLQAFKEEDLRGIYAYIQSKPSNDGEFSDELHHRITTAGLEGIAVRFVLLGFDAMCAAELIAIHLLDWQERTTIELMVYQHKFDPNKLAHPATSSRCMTLYDATP